MADPKIVKEAEYETKPVDGWVDPESNKKTLVDRIVALLEVKSHITYVCLYLFAFLVMNGKIGSDQFMTIFGIVIAFYFGTQYGKANK